MEPGNLADVAVQIMSTLATGATTSIGTESGKEVVRLVRERLGGSEEGRAVLARLDNEPQLQEAQQEVRTLLTDEISGNAGFARQLEAAVLPPTVHAGRDALLNTLTIHHSKVSGTINIGPLTIHKTRGSYIVLAVAAVAVALLLVLGSIGTVNIINNFNDGSGGESGSVQGGSSAPKQRWKFDKGMTPTVSDGVAYFGSMDKSLYAVDAATGEERWKFGTGGFLPSSSDTDGWGSPPTVAGGVVYSTSVDGNLYAVDAKTGNERWAFDAGGPLVRSPAVADGLVYVSTVAGTLYAVDAASGKRRWVFDTGTKEASAPTVAGGVVYVGSRNLYARDAATGEKRWTFDADGAWVSSVAVVQGVVYFGSTDDSLYARDAATGEERWTFKAGDEVQAPPAVADGMAYFGSVDGKLYAVDTATGRQRWNLAIDGGVRAGSGLFSSPVVANDAVYLASAHGLYAVDAATGRERWRHATDRGFPWSPVVADGILYAVGVDLSKGMDSITLYALKL
jgi:outer membrane protein assembly factor BamB